MNTHAPQKPLNKPINKISKPIDKNMNVPKGRFSSIHVKHAVISAGLDVCWSSLGPSDGEEEGDVHLR